MELIVWSSSYVLGHFEIDRQHQGLVKILNELFDQMSKGKSKEILGATFVKLKDYTVKHFVEEEKLMLLCGYPGLEGHKKEHLFFIEKLNTIKQKFDSGNDYVAIEVVNFLKEWLIKHILKTDKAYIPHFQSKGII